MPRKLRHEDVSRWSEVDEEFLTGTPRSLVILGEAGMGKSTLLRRLQGVDGYAFCSARRLILEPNPASLLGSASTLVVDALDEVGAAREGYAATEVVRALARLGRPRFILSCRVADWQSRTTIADLALFYDPPPLELHLEALGRRDALAFLAGSFGRVRAREIVRLLQERGLEDLWANPQTLTMIADVAANGPLPESKGALFEAAIHLMCGEHNGLKGDTVLNRTPEEEVLDAAGAAFAALILTSRETVCRGVTASDDDLSLRELGMLSGAARLSDVLDARLFAAAGTDRFGYTHRAIGEFLGARWLLRQADTARKRRRLLTLFHDRQVVPVSLRGIHAWLAWNSADLAVEVIGADPMGVVEYGDTDELGPKQAAALFRGIARLSRDDPAFRSWRDYGFRGLARRELLPEILDVLRDPDVETAFRYTAIQVLKGTRFVGELADDLHRILMDQGTDFAPRSEAGEVLALSKVEADWPDVVRKLLAEGGESGPQLAMELLCEVGLDAFDDPLVLAVVLGQIERLVSQVGVYRRLQDLLPGTRAEALLDGLAGFTMSPRHSGDSVRVGELADFVFGLTAGRLRAGSVEPARFWRWITPFRNASAIRYPSWDTLAEVIQTDPEFRFSVQRHVLIGGSQNVAIPAGHWELTWFKGFGLDERDVVRLLDELDPADQRWRDLVQVVPHSPDKGTAVRQAANRFVDRFADRDWLNELSVPRVPEWMVQQQQNAEMDAAARQSRLSELRVQLAGQIDALREGRARFLLDAAAAYIGRLGELGDDGSDGATRLEDWLGPKLGRACLAGFEAFLVAAEPRPTATDIAESNAQGRSWYEGWIIVVAFLERQRLDLGFADLPVERLMACVAAMWSGSFEDVSRAGELQGTLIAEMRHRGAWEAMSRLMVEPKLRSGADCLWLSRITAGGTEAALAGSLVAEWLGSYPDASRAPEAEMIDFLLDEGDHGTLAALASIRRGRVEKEERLRNWEAVGLAIDFATTSADLDARGPPTPELLWAVRARFEEGTRTRVSPGPEGLAWLVARFRSMFPATPMPLSSCGSDNAWDASRYIRSLVSRLGEDTSDAAVARLAELTGAPPDGYTPHIKIVAAEQRRRKVEEEYIPPTFTHVKSVLEDSRPTTTEQLQDVVLEELAQAQKAISGSDLDWYKDFFAHDGGPRQENSCRHTLLKMTTPMPFGIEAIPERHLGDDKRCDVACILSGLLVPIEVKGQWHPELWTAADQQLDRQYNNDMHADRGIYLVFWFGTASSKPPTRPPKAMDIPTTAEELRVALTACSDAARRGRVTMVVLDMTRPGGDAFCSAKSSKRKPSSRKLRE